MTTMENIKWFTATINIMVDSEQIPDQRVTELFTGFQSGFNLTAVGKAEITKVEVNENG